MKNLSSVIGFVALVLCALATSSCEYEDSHQYGHHGSNPYGQYGRDSYDDHSRYAHDPHYQEGEYRRSEAYGQRDGYDRDEDRQTSIVIPVPAY